MQSARLHTMHAQSHTFAISWLQRCTWPLLQRKHRNLIFFRLPMQAFHRVRWLLPRRPMSSVASYSSGAALKKEKIMILGSGWAGYAALRNIDKTKYDVVVISPRNHFLFTPLLCSTTVGTLEFRSIIQPIREHMRQDEHYYHLATAEAIDLAAKKVTCKSVLDQREEVVPYDKLVIAVGAQPNTFGIPGVTEHAFFLKELHHARAIRQRLLENIELAVEHNNTEMMAQLCHCVVVGGGPTGVEFSAELADFIERDIKRLYPAIAQHMRVSLVEGSTVLGQFHESLRHFALSRIAGRPYMKVIRDHVTAVHADRIELKSGAVIPCGLKVWTAGIRTPPVLAKLALPKTPSGHLEVDDCLRVLGHSDVYALGDCAVMKPRPLPATAQVAEQQAGYLAQQLNALPAREAFAKPFVFRNMGMLVYLGANEVSILKK